MKTRLEWLIVGVGRCCVASWLIFCARGVVGMGIEDAETGFVLEGEAEAMNLLRSRGTAIQP